MGTYMRTRFIVGKCYLVHFQDHCAGQDKIMDIKMIGWCVKADKTYVVLSAWRVDTDDQETIDANNEPVTIIKKCITSKRLIKV